MYDLEILAPKHLCDMRRDAQDLHYLQVFTYGSHYHTTIHIHNITKNPLKITTIADIITMDYYAK